MQDRTINNALKALVKQGGSQGRLAEVMLEMRGVSWSSVYQDRPLGRGQTKRVVLDCVRDGLCSTPEIAKRLRIGSPDITHASAQNRVYQCLLRLEDQGVVVRDGGVWKLAL